MKKRKMKSLTIPEVKRVGNFIEVSFNQMKLPKKVFKETRYPNICEILLNENDEPLIPTLKMGATLQRMECQGDGRWTQMLPRKALIVLLYDGREYDCGIL